MAAGVSIVGFLSIKRTLLFKYTTQRLFTADMVEGAGVSDYRWTLVSTVFTDNHPQCSCLTPSMHGAVATVPRSLQTLINGHAAGSCNTEIKRSGMGHPTRTSSGPTALLTLPLQPNRATKRC